MNGGLNNVLMVCALCCCALSGPAHAETVSANSQTAANTQVDTADTGARMKHLAQRLAESESEQTHTTPLAEAAVESDAAIGDTSSGPATRTPLLRSGASLDDSSVVERPDSASWLLETLTALGIVIGLVIGARYVYARMGGKVATYASPVVEVLSRTTVAPRSHVMLLRVGGRVLVVSDSSAGMRTLASLEDPEEVADILGAVSAAKPTSISRGFSQLLHRFTDDHEKQGADLDGIEAEASGAPGKAHDTVSNLLSRVRGLGRSGGAS